MIGIVAKSLNNAIGIDDKLPWHYKDDMLWFRFITNGQNIIFGRKTYENIPNNEFKDRNVYVLTSNKDYKPKYDNVHVIHSINDAPKNSFLCGGLSLYNNYLRDCEEIYVTVIPETINNATHYLEFDFKGYWFTRIVKRENGLEILHLIKY